MNRLQLSNPSNEDTMARYRPEMKKYHYDPSKYKTYLDQLGIKYPTVR
jgi:aminobenzoyl-glutamate utilization protein B